MIRFLFLLFLLPALLLQAQTPGMILESNRTISYKTFGEGKPILIINGGPGMNSNGFQFMAEKIAALGYQTILFDQRGTGGSILPTVDSTTLTMDLMVEDVEAIRQHFKLKKLIILGHSFGGMLAGAYAAAHPNRIEGIIFSSSGGLDIGFVNDLSITTKLSSGNLEKLQYWSDQIAAGDTSFHARLERGRALAPAYLYNQDFVPVIAKRLTEGNMTINGLIWADLRRTNFDYYPKLNGRKFPVLVLQGDHDVMPLSIGEKIVTAFPNSKMIVLKNCAHYGWLDAPDQYFGAIKEWVLGL